jgi:hypothetical protein
MTPAASLLHWRIKLSCRISPLRRPRPGNLFICAKDLLVEANPARASLHRLSKGNILLPNSATGASRVYGERHGGDRRGLCRFHGARHVISDWHGWSASGDGLFDVAIGFSGGR